MTTARIAARDISPRPTQWIFERRNRNDPPDVVDVAKGTPPPLYRIPRVQNGYRRSICGGGAGGFGRNIDSSPFSSTASSNAAAARRADSFRP